MISWREFRWRGVSSGLALSVILHGLILLGLLITLPEPEAETEPEEQVVEVTMVEPPEAPEAPDLPPEPEAQPEPEPEPEAEFELEPGPEPEAAPDQPQSEEAATEPETAPETEQSQAPDAAGAGEAAPIPVLRPVFRFGEEDSGPRLAPDGDSAEEPARPESSDSEAADPAESEPLQPEQSDAPSLEVETETEIQTPEPPGIAAPETVAPEMPETPPPPGIALPEIALSEAPLPDGALPEPDPDAAPVELSGPPAETSAAPSPDPGAPDPELPQADPDPDAADAAAPDPGAADAAGPDPADPELVEAGKLFSPVLTEDRAAMTAMGSLPRGLRASQLCTTELREQLRTDPGRYGVELLPSYQLDEGNVLAVPDAAFRADGAWYDLSFRCTVDDDALQVTGFAHKVGAPIPRDQWSARGFPSF